MVRTFMNTLLLSVLLPFMAACSSAEGTEAIAHANNTTDNDTTGMETIADSDTFTVRSTVGEVERDAAFGDFGTLLFPVDRRVPDNMTLGEVNSSSVYVWYNYIRPEATVDIVNTLHRRAVGGDTVFYRFYTDEEIRRAPEKAYTGLFFFRGRRGAPFAVCNAGGGFMYVGAMHDSFPHALALSRMGYNAFAVIYRPDTPYDDLARALAFIHDHAQELGVHPDGYSLWGGSAGARMAAVLGNGDPRKG